LSEHEIVLAGGHVNAVVRIGDTVRRTTQRDSAMVEALLTHLHDKGFAHAPRFLGIDDQGRQILTYLPGAVLFDKDDFSDAQLQAAAQLLQLFHDHTTDFPPVLAAAAEVMCHNDWTPANTVFVAGHPTGMIDFDTIRPGTRLWDLTYSVWTWLSLGEDRWTPADQWRRLELFVAAYDHPACTPELVAACLPGRQAGRAHWASRLGRTAGADWANACLAWTLTHITNHYHPDGLP
tara:strand:+ start:74 stop:778 length:705 start_codon:yes stop_codon:yes gene_type:complete